MLRWAWLLAGVLAVTVLTVALLAVRRRLLAVAARGLLASVPLLLAVSRRALVAWLALAVSRLAVARRRTLLTVTGLAVAALPVRIVVVWHAAMHLRRCVGQG